VTGGIIGRVLARRIAAELLRSRADGGGPKLVVTNFKDPEVASALASLDGFTLDGAAGPVKLVADVGGAETVIPTGFHLQDDRSLTWYRNNSSDGLVLFVLSEASDRQGLGQLYRVTDRTLLEQPEGTRMDPAAWLIDEAWDAAGPVGLEHPPESLGVEATMVHAGVTRSDPIGLRLWAKYLIEVSQHLRGLDRAVTVEEIREVLGRRLPALDMFPDPRLFDDPRNAQRALERNRYCAAGRDPKGKQVVEGFLAQRIDDVQLAARSDDPDGAATATAKDAMRLFAATFAAEAREQIDFADWSLLFDKTTRREGLGSGIRHALEGREELAALFEDLDVESGLDEGDADAAASVLDAQTPAGEAFADLLSPALRRRIERMAVPPSRLEADPLQALLRHLVNADDMPLGARLRLGIDAAPAETGELSLAVFRLLYARTLLEVADQSDLGDGRTLGLDPELAVVAWPAPRDPRDDDEPDHDPWAPVHLGLWMGDDETPRYRFRWWPEDRDGYAALAASIRGGAFPPPAELAADIEAQANHMLSVLVEGEVPEQDQAPVPGLAGEWLSLRSAYFEKWAVDGIGADDLAEYVGSWSEILARARDELIPENSPMRALDDFLDVDTARLGNGRAAMLASHPLRLRWLSGHLAKLGADLSAALSGTFELNSENDHLYFESIGRVSAHRQPPMLVTGADEVLAAAREFGLHEEYTAVDQGRTSEAWIGVVDEGAIKSLGETVTTYLSSFPYKLDGLGLLLLVKDGDPRVPERLIREVSRANGAGLVTELHIVAPRDNHQAIALSLGEAGSDGSRDSQLLPRLRLTMHDWPADQLFAPLIDQLAGRIDLALVPNLFGAQTQLQPKTRQRVTAAGGRFDPWLDSASHAATVAGGPGENVSRILLPASPDPLLESWSTLSVRRYLQSPVAPDASDNTDYLTLQVTFGRNRTLFDQLHEVAHWVVTLDPFVGRDQIDALDSPPDVILVRTGLGKNKTHTLVVSSRSGRRFVVRGLERRLGATLGFVTGEECTRLAERLYDVARNTVPGITLRALGLGRGVEEILGLTVTRFAVEEYFPIAEDGDGFEWWLSLDDHLSWFGGAQGLRADLLRVVARLEEGELALRLEVVESKFRQHEDLGTADQQLSRSLELLQGALAPRSEAREASDAVFWRRELVSALDETSRRHALKRDLPALRVFGDTPDESLYRAVRDRMLEGSYSLDCHGIACLLATDLTGQANRGSTDLGHSLLRMTRDSILGVLDDIAQERDPRPLVDEGPGASGQDPPLSDEIPGTEAVGDVSPASREAPSEATAQLPASRGLSTGDLEARYQRILDSFHEFRVGVEIPEGVRVEEGPGFYLARIVPGAGVSADKLMSRTTDLKLRLGLPHELDLRTYADRGAVVFEIPKVADERYDVDAEQLWSRTAVDAAELSVAIGEDISGGAVLLDFSSSDSPHLLVAGTTGSGKSVALETILRGLCRAKGPDELRLHLIDPKGTELVEFDGDDHVAGAIGMDADDAIATLEAAVDEMQRRYTLFKALRVRDLPSYNRAVADAERLPWWLIVLDEYADLTADPEEKRDLEALLRRLAQKARAAGLHVIIATQRPSADVISPVVRSNLPAQLALRVRTGTDSRVILDEAGAEALAGRGDGLLRTARGIVRLQCARIAG
jgi:S-DNA-T family DNA segregation ATPase FtsK/SpoIIIE